MTSPCEDCTRLLYPERCDNTRCGVWQRWFLRRWELIHLNYILLCKEKAYLEELERQQQEAAEAESESCPL